MTYGNSDDGTQTTSCVIQSHQRMQLNRWINFMCILFSLHKYTKDTEECCHPNNSTQKYICIKCSHIFSSRPGVRPRLHYQLQAPAVVVMLSWMSDMLHIYTVCGVLHYNIITLFYLIIVWMLPASAGPPSVSKVSCREGDHDVVISSTASLSFRCRKIMRPFENFERKLAGNTGVW